ncbi:MAG: ArsR/SmtB family transcription factor [Candidatus Ranarchaeia archaeon]
MPQNPESCNPHTANTKKITEIQNEMPEELLTEKVVQVFKTLGSITRFKILFALTKEELCVCDIAEVLGKSITATSHQLRILRDQELIRSRRDGTTIYYSLMCDHVPHLIDTGLIHIKKEVFNEP